MAVASANKMRFNRGNLLVAREQAGLGADRDQCAHVVEEIDKQKYEHDLQQAQPERLP